MATIDNETERRLRELNGVLDMAVLLAVDVICEHDAHGLSKHEWQRRGIGEAARKLTDAGQFPGRLALFADDELRALAIGIALADGVASDGFPTEPLMGEVEFEMARRGFLHQEGTSGD